MMNPKAQQIHAANRERMLRERAAMRARFVAATIERAPAKTLAAGCSRDVGEAEFEKRETRERECLRCETPFQSEGVGHRLCWSCARLPEGFGL